MKMRLKPRARADLLAIRAWGEDHWGPKRTRDFLEGLIEAVTDKEILTAYKMLAALEGVFCEPASAASVAGIIKKAQELEDARYERNGK